MGGERRRRAPTVLHFEPVRPPEARTAGAAPHCLPGYPAILSLAWRPLASPLSITFQTLRAGFAGWRGGTCPSSGRRTGSASPPTTSAGGPPRDRRFCLCLASCQSSRLNLHLLLALAERRSRDGRLLLAALVGPPSFVPATLTLSPPARCIRLFFLLSRVPPSESISSRRCHCTNIDERRGRDSY